MTIAVLMLAAVTGAGFAVHGWAGIVLWPLGLCGLVLVLGIALFVINVVVTFVRHNNEMSRMWARICPLPTEQLRDLCANPSHGDSAFARVELMRRGQDARPSKEQLFEMLTSGNTILCGQAMSYASMFYPELRDLVADGSSNQDPPEVWQSRVAAVRSAGEPRTAADQLGGTRSS